VALPKEEKNMTETNIRTDKSNCVIGYKNENGNIVNSHFFKDIPDKPASVEWQCSNTDKSSQCEHVREFKNKFDEYTFNNQDNLRTN
tara:strand:- start:598 stop:858 length:261 start_codon:yes stop_codon:yes gene_type:complete